MEKFCLSKISQHIEKIPKSTPTNTSVQASVFLHDHIPIRWQGGGHSYEWAG